MDIPKQRLVREVRVSLEAGEMTDRLANYALKIADGYICSARPKMQGADRDCVLSDFALRLVADWQKLDPEGNPFSWLTGKARFALLDWERKGRAKKRNLTTEMPRDGSEELVRLERYNAARPGHRDVYFLEMRVENK